MIDAGEVVEGAEGAIRAPEGHGIECVQLPDGTWREVRVNRSICVGCVHGGAEWWCGVGCVRMGGFQARPARGP